MLIQKSIEKLKYHRMIRTTMDPNVVITLIFPNYSIEPVRQKWRLSTLCNIPYFDRMLNPESEVQWSDTNTHEIELEDDPELFSLMMRYVLGPDREQRLRQMSDYYGVDIAENAFKKKKHPVIKSINLTIAIPAGGNNGAAVLPPCKRVMSFKMARPRSFNHRDSLEVILYIDERKLHVSPFGVDSGVIPGVINDSDTSKETHISVNLNAFATEYMEIMIVIRYEPL